MALVTIPNTFTNGTPADATKVNANFTAVTDQVNGNLQDANVAAAAAIQESKILFSATGHGHGGGADGEVLVGTNIPIALNNSTRGAMIYKSGTATVNALSTLAISFTGEAFGSVPVITVRRTTGGANTRQYEGDLSLDPGWTIAVESATGFSITNASSSQQTYAWQAVGI